MPALSKRFRTVSGSRLALALVVMTLIAGGFPARAQSPIAYPPIKLIHLYEHTCPAGVDPLAGSLTDAANACPSATSSVNFTLTSQDPSFAPQTHPTDSLGATEWHEISSGFPYAIQQAVPAGYGNPVVRCQMGQNVQTGANYVEITFDAPGGRLDIGTGDLSLTYFMDNSCYWFDIPAGQTGPGSEAAQQVEDAVSDGGVPADTPTSTPIHPKVTDEVPQVDVAVSDGGVPTSTPTTTPTPTPLLATESGSEGVPQAQSAQPNANEGDAAASPQVQAAEAGGTRLDIRAWECPFHYDAAVATVDELLANCTRPHRDANFIINGDPTTQQYTGDIGATSYQNVPFGTVTIQQLAYGSFDPVRVFCYTQPFTASHGPLQASQEIGFTEEPGDTFSVSITVDPGDAIDCIWFDSWLTEDEYGSVLLHKYVCPDGTNTAGFDMDLLLHACPEPQQAYFQFGPNTGNETDANGYLGFINFSPGSYLLRETEPLGYVPARIFCRSYNADDWNHIVDPWVEQPITNTTGITVQLQAHWETECTWFDIKGVNYGYLDIAARSCPLTFAPTATTPRLTYAQQCQNGITGAMFDISSFPDFALSVTSADGYATFQEHIPARGMTISYSSPQAYALVAVFCGDAPFIGIGAIPTNWQSFSNGFVQYEVPIDYQIVCEYYFQPIAIVDTGVASPEAGVTAADEDTSASTGDESANAEASPAAAATTEESTAGAGSDNGTPQSGTGGQSGGPSANQGSSAGVPEPSQPSENANAPATLALVAYSCPPGYDLYSADMAPSGDCPDPAIGIDFTMTGPAGSAHQATSNAGGELSLTDLPPGSYVLRAALPPEIESAFIANCVSDLRDLSSESPFIPIAYAGPDGQIGITLLPGEALACSWYDIPAAQGVTVTGQLFTCPGTTVIKTQCAPGTGPATLTFEPAPGQSGAPFDLLLGDDGSAQATALAGTYALTGIPIDACLVESDGFDSSGQLVLEEGAAVEVRVYTCGGS